MIVLFAKDTDKCLSSRPRCFFTVNQKLYYKISMSISPGHSFSNRCQYTSIADLGKLAHHIVSFPSAEFDLT